MTPTDTALEELLRFPVTVACRQCGVDVNERCVDVGTDNRRGDRAQHTLRLMDAIRALFGTDADAVRAAGDRAWTGPHSPTDAATSEIVAEWLWTEADRMEAALADA